MGAPKAPPERRSLQKAIDSMLAVGGIYLLLSFDSGRSFPAGGFLFFEEAFFIAILSEAIFYIHELYDEEPVAIFKTTFVHLAKILLVSAFLILGLYFFPPSRPLVQPFLADSRFVPLALLLILTTALHKPSLERLIARFYPPQQVLILGTGELARILTYQILKNDQHKYQIVGFVRPPTGRGKTKIMGIEVLEAKKRLPQLIKEHQVKKIVVATNQRRGCFQVKELLSCKMQGIEVVEPHDLYEELTGKILIQNLRPSWLIFSPGFKRCPLRETIKASLDRVFALIGLIVSAPLMLIIAVLIKLDSPGPVFFKQERAGQGGRLFTLIKFRTMKHGAEEESGPVWAKENDGRITRVGKIIRKLRIDELPQMVNVLKGEMSFIGPRPERPYFVEKLQQVIPYYKQRLVVKPGITGWAAVNFQYGATIDDAAEKLQYDIYYIKHLSLALDLIIVFKTIRVILTGQGAR